MTDIVTPEGEKGAELAAATAQWLAGFPPETWPSLMAMQAQTIMALAAVERSRRRKRRAAP